MKIPIMKTEEGKILCIENSEPMIVVSGEKGMGMSLLSHRISDGLYQKYGNKVAWLNDRLDMFDKKILEEEMEKIK